MEGLTAMDNAEPYDLITVLLRLEGLKGMAHEIGGQSTDELHVAGIDDGRTGLFRKMLASLRPWRSARG
jgi:hypothetical protein